MTTVLFAAILAIQPAGPGVEAGSDPDEGDFFERRIRPVLVEHCYECHAVGTGARARPVKGRLRLDTRAGLRRGGATGPALVVGDPDSSLLLRALRYRDKNLRMPPGGQLPEAVVEDFAAWIESGAVDPRTLKAEEAPDAAKHWAFQPLRKPDLAEPETVALATTRIDRFVGARLAAAGLSPSPVADRNTLIRRLYFDLLGLPPSVSEIECFVRDRSPDAYSRLVDRLLASPRYGERWGRHWLDVARYSDTKDVVLVRGKDAIRPYAYTYRDYVVRAFNEDLPYDRFVEDQLAASDIDLEEEPWRLAAMGFLTVGRVFNNINPHDIYDDQIDVVTRGLLGLTVACARCHDHKYDPIPTADYYSLHGVFANSVTPERLPLIRPPVSSPEYDKFAEDETKVLSQQRDLIDEQYQIIRDGTARRVGDYLVEVVNREPDPLATAIFFVSLSPNDLRPRMIHRLRLYLERRSRSDDPVFGPWHDLLAVPENELEARAGGIVARWLGVEHGTERGQINPRVEAMLQSARFSKYVDVARTYGALFTNVYEELVSMDAAAQEGERLGQAEEQLLETVSGESSPFHFLKRDTWQYLSRVPLDNYRRNVKSLDSLAVDSTAAPPRAMTLIDARELYSPTVFLRGDPTRPGREVPRQFLGVASGEDRRPFENGAGRLELARAIVAPDNPLTARVIVNRVWMHHVGEPLVTTPSDFGLRSDPPSHPALLDDLAVELIGQDWSLKQLHRRILLSHTYRQSSADRPEGRQRDPENRLLWRAHRRRLGLEAMRDAVLAVAGRLDTMMFGRAVDIAGDASNRRRTVYGLVDRQDLPSLFRSFDFASPDQTAAQRPRTTVPQQALFAMNSRFIVEQVRSLAALTEVQKAAEGLSRVRALYRRVLAREPSSVEESTALLLVREAQRERNVSGRRETSDGAAGDDQLDGWEQLAQVLLLTNEFLFVD